jgi:UDP-GlcNAc:undecaprenyl-phosphate/decaprenyl-phosphate GlcNAc-1-phosphate transferase
VAVASGVCIESVQGHAVAYWLAAPATVFWLMYCTNAFNLIDGVDGLATGVGLFATLTVLAAGLMRGNTMLVLATAPLAAALLGFLRYNFNPASIFLGDGGSYTIGFLLGCYGVLWSQKAATVLGMTAPLMALAVPLLDTSLSIVRRYLRSQPLFEGDRGHIHHRLLQRGMTTRRTVLLLYGISAVFAVLSLVSSAKGGQYAGVVLVLFSIVAWAGIQSLGYVEFGMASRLLFQGSLRRTLNTQLSLLNLGERLGAEGSEAAKWGTLQDVCREFGFCRLRMEHHGVVRVTSLKDQCTRKQGCPKDAQAACANVWTMKVPFNGSGYVELSHGFETRYATGGTLGPLAALVREKMVMPEAIAVPAPQTALHAERDRCFASGD